MSEEKAPEIEFVLTPEQKASIGTALNSYMMSPFTTFPDSAWDWENVPNAPFNMRVVTGVGVLLVPLTDEQIVGLLRQIVDGIEYQSGRISAILADVTG
jgi:hypothetical protein